MYIDIIQEDFMVFKGNLQLWLEINPNNYEQNSLNYVFAWHDNVI